MRITNQLFINNAKTVHKQLRLTVYKQCVCVLLRALAQLMALRASA